MMITSELVYKLRNISGAGIMDCKKALVICNGDIDKALEELKKKGIILAEKKSSRDVKEGIVHIVISEDYKKCAIVEVNCETDFVACQNDFKIYVDKLSNFVLNFNVNSVNDLNDIALFKDLELERVNLVSKLGENIFIRRVKCIISASGSIGYYLHFLNGISKIGVIVILDAKNDILAHDIAMQIAALNPEYICESNIPASRIEYEKSILSFKLKESCQEKPESVLSKILEGQVSKFIDSITLYGQNFIKNNKTSVREILLQNKLNVIDFIRYEIGIK